MKPPLSFRVAGQRFAVKLVAHLVRGGDGHDHPAQDLNGLTDRDLQFIALSTSMGPDKAREVYLHEALHAIVGIAGLNVQALSFDEEEDVINRLSPILLTFLRDNPRVVAYLTERTTR